MKKIFVISLIIIIVAIIVIKFTSKKDNNIAVKEEKNITIRIAKQYGMQYSPVYVAEKLDLFKKHIPNANIEWYSFAGGAAMNEALIGGHLDIGFMGLPPAIIAIDKGAPLKIAMGISVPPSNLMVKNNKIKSIKDFKDTDKIAVPGIGSIQHITLSIAAKKILNNPNFFDNKLVAMANPDAYTALVSNTEITAHMASMPYIEKEANAGFKNILSIKDALGDASIICVASEKFYSNSTAYAGVISAIQEAISIINNKDAKVLDIVSEIEKIDRNNVESSLFWEGSKYTTSIYGLLELKNYMYETGYIKNDLNLNNLLYENALTLIEKRSEKLSPTEIIHGK